jgi:hypothetical protein
MYNTFSPKIVQLMSYDEKYGEPWGPEMTSQHGPYALHAGKVRLHGRAHMHTRRRLNVAL